MPAYLAQAAAVTALATWILWKIVRRFVLRSPLDNIPGPPSTSFFYGSLAQLLTMNAWHYHDSLVENYPGIAKLQGPMGSRMLYVFEPSALHNILVKDQYIYEEGRFFIKSNRMVFGEGLIATLGDHHRKQRKMLNPVFSTKHMRSMLPILYDVGRSLVRAIESRVSTESTEIDMVEWMARTALELVGQAGLGYSFDPLVQDKPDEYASAIKMFNAAMGSSAVIRRLLPYLPTIRWRGLGHLLLRMVPNAGARRLVDISDTFHARSTAIYKEKKRALRQGDAAVAQQIGEGRDIMSILLKANMEASGTDKLSEQELIAQMSTLILAAMDTTSNALSLILTRLAEHPEVQEKLREEIVNAGADKGLDFDTLTSLPYLEAVCRETLRRYAPVTQVFRETRRDVVLPLSEPITGIDGAPIHEILVPKDTTVVVGLLNCNRSQALWGADADEWKPERWLSPLPSTITDAKVPGVYSNLMTFLGGGRACIGFKFSQLEMKVVLSLLLLKFTFAPSDKPIFWNSAAVRYPSVDGYGEKPSLPMKVGLVKRSA